MAGKLQKELHKIHGFDSLEQEVFLNLQRTADALQRQLEALFKAHHLSSTQYNVLRILRGAGQRGLPCQAVAQQMVTRDPDITRLMDRLEKRGLISRERDGDDRRIVVARISPDGTKILSALDHPVTQAHRQQLRHMTPDHLRHLSDLLEEARQSKNP